MLVFVLIFLQHLLFLGVSLEPNVKCITDFNEKIQITHINAKLFPNSFYVNFENNLKLKINEKIIQVDEIYIKNKIFECYQNTNQVEGITLETNSSDDMFSISSACLNKKLCPNPAEFVKDLIKSQSKVDDFVITDNSDLSWHKIYNNHQLKSRLNGFSIINNNRYVSCSKFFKSIYRYCIFRIYIIDNEEIYQYELSANVRHFSNADHVISSWFRVISSDK